MNGVGRSDVVLASYTITLPTTDAGVVTIYVCSMKGNFVGTQKCECVLGERDGEWQKVRGVCVSVVLIILLCVVVFVVIIIILTIHIHSHNIISFISLSHSHSLHHHSH